MTTGQWLPHVGLLICCHETCRSQTTATTATNATTAHTISATATPTMIATNTTTTTAAAVLAIPATHMKCSFIFVVVCG